MALFLTFARARPYIPTWAFSLAKSVRIKQSHINVFISTSTFLLQTKHFTIEFMLSNILLHLGL